MCIRVDTEESEDSRIENTQYLQYLRVQLKIPAGVRDLKSKIANVSNKSFSGTVATVHRYIGKKKSSISICCFIFHIHKSLKRVSFPFY